ncbi:MAG: hypothetical protein DLM72_18895 [Candidatus Nitrosopolaris wilkensis]|nr:MAG: hypothetical protein DLM72_18895 [Candidatus Nitrosopolaris wilkensis]
MDFMVKHMQPSLRVWHCIFPPTLFGQIYQLVLDVVPPIPSAADYLLLGAYGILGYYLFMTYKQFQKKFNLGRKALIASVIGNAIFLGYIVALTVNLSVLSTSRGIEMFLRGKLIILSWMQL